MLPSFNIALRFFVESKRSMFFSCLGVVFGVGFFICGQAQTEGFQRYFIDVILGSKGAIIVSDRFQKSFTRIMSEKDGNMVAVANPQSRKYYPGIADAYRVMRTLNNYPNVAACAPVVEGDISLRAGFRRQVCVLQGIDLTYHLAATDLQSQIIDGEFDQFRNEPDGLIVGRLLANKLDLFIGQNVFLVGPDNDSRRFKVVAFYETGINVIDEKRLYVHRRAAQSVLHAPFQTSFLIVQLYDPSRAPADAEAFEELLSHRSRSWQEREKSNMQIFETLRISAGLAITGIIFLAGFGIFNVLSMSVLEKTKEISILRSMGYTQTDIKLIFIWQGLLVSILGILLGWVFGASLTYLVSFIPIKIRGMFKADNFIVLWSIRHYVWAAILAFISVIVAAYLPARKAAKLQPVEILRGTSQ